MDVDEIERRGLFDPNKHPRGKGAQGGQFVAKGASGNNDTIGYDARRGTGAGYGTNGKGDARVKQLQKILNNLGFTDMHGKPLQVDGKLGPRTTAAIKRLQRKMGMKADGLVTPALLKRIQSVDSQRHTAFKSGKKGTREAALSSLSAKPSRRRHTVARPAKKVAATPAKKATTPAKRTGR
jgi:peptidoglycan hydrolase-like protein with peptidoglycan-binding domain